MTGHNAQLKQDKSAIAWWPGQWQTVSEQIVTAEQLSTCECFLTVGALALWQSLKPSRQLSRSLV